jgi:hypothetical protein
LLAHQYFPTIAGHKQRMAAYEMNNDLRRISWVWSDVRDHFQVHIRYLATDRGNSDKLRHASDSLRRPPFAAYAVVLNHLCTAATAFFDNGRE